MQEFEDALGRKWSIELSPQVCQRVHNATGVNIGDPLELSVLPNRPDKLGEALYQVCWVGAVDRGVSRDAFLASLNADAELAGWRAVVSALVAYRRGNSEAASQIAHFAERVTDILNSTLPAEMELAA